MSSAMQLSEDVLEQIGRYVRRNLGIWMHEVYPQTPTHSEILERIVRVEEELKTQRELMQQGFAHVDKRFEDVDRRFEDVNRRFEDVNQRFEDMNTRFEDMNTRFEDMNNRLEDLYRNSTRWLTVLTSMVAILGIAGIVLPLLT